MLFYGCFSSLARDTTKTPAQHRPGILHSHRNCLTVCFHDRCASFLCYSRLAFVFPVMIIAYVYAIVKGSLQIYRPLLYGNSAKFAGCFLLQLHNRSGTVSKTHTVHLCVLPQEASIVRLYINAKSRALFSQHKERLRNIGYSGASLYIGFIPRIEQIQACDIPGSRVCPGSHLRENDDSALQNSVHRRCRLHGS